VAAQRSLELSFKRTVDWRIVNVPQHRVFASAWPSALKQLLFRAKETFTDTSCVPRNLPGLDFSRSSTDSFW
jgi:hypothetical protein